MLLLRPLILPLMLLFYVVLCCFISLLVSSSSLLFSLSSFLSCYNRKFSTAVRKIQHNMMNAPTLDNTHAGDNISEQVCFLTINII